MNDIVKLSESELHRARILQECLAQRVKNSHAAAQLGITRRHLRRLKRAYQQHGVKALASKKRGKPSNNQLPCATKRRALELLHTRYPDFGPALAHEKLTEDLALDVSRETVRQWMIAERLWKAHRSKRVVIHPLRERRAQRGELVQIDGSPLPGLKTVRPNVRSWSLWMMPRVNSWNYSLRLPRRRTVIFKRWNAICNNMVARWHATAINSVFFASIIPTI